MPHKVFAVIVQNYGYNNYVIDRKLVTDEQDARKKGPLQGAPFLFLSSSFCAGDIINIFDLC